MSNSDIDKIRPDEIMMLLGLLLIMPIVFAVKAVKFLADI